MLPTTELNCRVERSFGERHRLLKLGLEAPGKLDEWQNLNLVFWSNAMLKCDRAELCRDVLLDEGYRAVIDDDGDVVFKAEGRGFIIILDDDETFFRLVMPNIWSLDSPGERANAVRAAHDATAELKVAKVFCSENNVWCTAELFFGEANHLKPVLNRLIQVVNQAATRFAEKMRA